MKAAVEGKNESLLRVLRDLRVVRLCAGKNIKPLREKINRKMLKVSLQECCAEKTETAAGKNKPLAIENCCAEKEKLLREKINRWPLRIVVQKKRNCCGKK